MLSQVATPCYFDSVRPPRITTGAYPETKGATPEDLPVTASGGAGAGDYNSHSAQFATLVP